MVRKNSGFTLLELLIVIGIIAVLSMIVMGASSYISRVAREKRVVMSCTVLETAIQAYHAEYDEWPGVPEDYDKPQKTFEEDNNEVLGPLRVTSSKNPNGISFIDETAFLTFVDDNIIPFAEVGAEKEDTHPFVFIPKSGKRVKSNGKPFYYKVVIDLAIDNVTVSAPSHNAADFDED